MIDPRFLAFLAVVIVGAGVYAANNSPGSTSSPTSTTPLPSTTTSSPTTAPAGTCDRLRTAPAGATITLDDTSSDCVIGYPKPDVTVTGNHRGSIACYRCDRWTFRDLTLDGSLHMVGGTAWQVLDSHLDGNNLGLYGVLSVGMTPEAGNPTRWTIARSYIGRPGNSPEHADNQDHALYLIAGNGIDLDGLIDDVTIEGSGAGAALKIGGTGNQGGFGGDAADGVEVRDVRITNQSALTGDGSCVLIAANSDFTRITDSDLSCQLAVGMGGPFTGAGTVLERNTITGKWLSAHVYNNPGAGIFAYLFGTRFVNYDLPNCGFLASCAGNVRV